MAIVAFLLGVITIFTPHANGITAIIGVILASISLSNEQKKEMQNVAITGLVLCIIGFFIPFAMFLLVLSGSKDPDREAEKKSAIYEVIPIYASTDREEILVVNFNKMGKETIQRWCEQNKVKCEIKEEYSDEISEGSFVRQEPEANTKMVEGGEKPVVYSLGKVPTEYKEALKKAEFYTSKMHLSKKRIFTRLTAKDDGNFSESAAQYAADRLEVDWNANALAKAKFYQNTMNMSREAIYQQLISRHGENFTKAEAQYAIDHLED